MIKQGDRVLQRAEECRDTGLFDLAVEAYQEAAALFKEDQSFDRQADAFTSLGKMYEQLLSDYHKALEAHQQSLRLRQMYGLKQLSDEYYKVAEQQNHLGMIAEARDNLERAKHSAKREGRQRTLGKTLILLGDILVEEGYLDEAEEHLRTALELVTDAGDDYMISKVQASIGLLLACRNRYDEALKACENALEHARRISDEGAMGTAHLRLGQTLWLSSDFSKAKDHLQKALEMAQRANVKIMQQTALDWLERCSSAGASPPAPEEKN
ncbi:tetratricopeptide repeat protein [Candidatus Zixiibacteriota bacterium]